MKIFNRPPKFTTRKIALFWGLRRVSLRIIRGPRSALLPILISDQLRHAAAAPKPPAHKARRSHSQVLHLLSLCPAPVNCRDCCFFSNSVTSTGGYCSNCYTHSIDQGRLPQEIVSHLYFICISLTGSPSAPPPLTCPPPLWFSSLGLCLTLHPMFSWSLGPSPAGPGPLWVESASWRVYSCILATQGGNNLMACKED